MAKIGVDKFITCPHCNHSNDVNKQFYIMERDGLNYMNVKSCSSCKSSFGLAYGMMGLHCYETLLMNNPTPPSHSHPSQTQT